MQAFILAGGFATRLWPLTEKRAKPLLPLAGKPLIEHLIEKIPQEIPITISTNAIFSDDFENWKNAFQSTSQHDIHILIEDSGDDDQKLGALGATAKWIQEEDINDDILLIAGDNYIGFSIRDFIKHFHGNPLLATHDIQELEKAKTFGTVITDGTSVKAFEEKPENPQSSLISTGCYILPKETLPHLLHYAQKNPDNIGGIFEHLLAINIDVDCAAFTEPWFDIGSFHAYLDATRTLVKGHVLRGEEVEENNVTFVGSVVIGPKSRIVNSTLNNVVLFGDCDIEDCILEHCIVDSGCILHGVDLSEKMLRSGTILKR